jgi:hypothetical protein
MTIHSADTLRQAVTGNPGRYLTAVNDAILRDGLAELAAYRRLGILTAYQAGPTNADLLQALRHPHGYVSEWFEERLLAGIDELMAYRAGGPLVKVAAQPQEAPMLEPNDRPLTRRDVCVIAGLAALVLVVLGGIAWWIVRTM